MFQFHLIFKEVFLNVMLKAIGVGGSLKVTGELIPGTRPYLQ